MCVFHCLWFPDTAFCLVRAPLPSLLKHSIRRCGYQALLSSPPSVSAGRSLPLLEGRSGWPCRTRRLQGQCLVCCCCCCRCCCCCCCCRWRCRRWLLVVVVGCRCRCRLSSSLFVLWLVWTCAGVVSLNPTASDHPRPLHQQPPQRLDRGALPSTGAACPDPDPRRTIIDPLPAVRVECRIRTGQGALTSPNDDCDDVDLASRHDTLTSPNDDCDDVDLGTTHLVLSTIYTRTLQHMAAQSLWHLTPAHHGTAQVSLAIRGTLLLGVQAAAAAGGRSAVTTALCRRPILWRVL